MSTHDGGPAFPRPLGHIPQSYSEAEHSQEGMTLRDYFAANADPRELCDKDGLPDWAARAVMGVEGPMPLRTSIERVQWWATAVAKWKYMQADAMLKVRAEGGAA